ncbi:MAG: 1-deoxy-D-xylulose-5-phosphate synthase [Pseudomonadota bacterium]|nr:1-deoxy-D-xylulose-5-phosphate synthase [Pseudomonadota bacterium]
MTADGKYPLLDRVPTPNRLRELDIDQLPRLADELRAFLIESVSTSGGHFAAGLGAVEFTIALHYVFNTPYDRLVWDVGHQCYPHKVLTGRRDRLHTIRKTGGLSGFLKREESEYDAFGAGHSSTSISAALGMALASQRRGEDRAAVAIIGDGGLTAGLAYEALNHAGDVGADLLVVLNDNEMSISPNVGAVSNYLARLLSGGVYQSIREHGKQALDRMPPMRELARRTESHVKGFVGPGMLFEDLGMHYFGPVNGHDVKTLVRTLRNLRQQRGPRLLHLVTQKGHGYALAEENPVKYHGVSPFDPATGMLPSSNPKPVTYTSVFSDWLCDTAAADERLMGITPAMREGSGLVEFSQRFPDRYFDVGIAEQHSVTLAAGMAAEGAKPVVAIYSTFLQRAYDQVIHDVAIQNLPVLFAIDRAGLVGADGGTHNGSYDYTYLRCLPNMVVMAPADENETRQMLQTGFELDCPAAVRYPRGGGPGVLVQRDRATLPVGKAQVRRRGRGIALLAFGSMVTPAMVAGERLDATVVNMRFVKPLDEILIRDMARSHETLVTLEENVVAGGAGSAVAECLAAQGLPSTICHLGLPDRLVEHGEQAELLAECRLDADGIEAAVRLLQPGAVKSA